MGSIQKRIGRNGRASYRAQVRMLGQPAHTATFDRKADASAWIAERETGIKHGRHFMPNEAKDHTLGELLARHLETIRTRRPDAFAKQNQLLGWWKDELGAYALVHVTAARVAEKRDALRSENIGTDEVPRHRSPATVNRYLAALSRALSTAVASQWLPQHPMLGKRVEKEQEPPGRVRYLDDAERGRLLDAVRASPVSDLHTVVLLALTTGMRRGEIVGLRWRDVDLDRGVLILHKTKNRERRAAPIVPAVRELLQAHREQRRDGTDYVFPRAGLDAPQDFDKAFAAAVRAAGIEDFRFHDLRHTAASYLAMSGATAPEIAAVLGHKTLQMVKRYSHLSDAHVSAVVERMTGKFFGS
jgi:integrase